MTILTLVCSQSTGEKNTASASRMLHRFSVRLPHDIPVKGKCQFIEYMCIKRNGSDEDASKLINVSIPWLQSASSHIVGGAGNPAKSTAKDIADEALKIAAVARDKRMFECDTNRHRGRGILLCTPTDKTFAQPHDMVFSLNTTTIPSNFDITITSGADDSDYDNVMLLVMKFNVTTAGLF